MAIGAVGRYIKYFLESPKFMLEALLKQCLAMPIHNSQSESASQPPLHSNRSCQFSRINGESDLFRGNHLVGKIFTTGADIPAQP
jgi:hypothetical protein